MNDIMTESDSVKNLLSYLLKQEITFRNLNAIPQISSSLNNGLSGSGQDDIFKKKLNLCHEKYNKLLCSVIEQEYIEDGFISDSLRIFRNIADEFGYVISGMFLNDVYLKNAQNNKFIKSILYIMSELDPNYLRGAENGILAYALLNKDYELKDLALQCYEKWNDIRYLDVLKTFNIGIDYLDKYLEHIIQKLERKRVI